MKRTSIILSLCIVLALAGPVAAKTTFVSIGTGGTGELPFVEVVPQLWVLNDADAAGLAEMRYGAGREVNGVVITITLGTGVGGGLFMDGKLVPNLEIGKIFLESHDDVAEQYMAGRIKKEHGLKWFEYGERLNEFCLHIEHVFSPQLIIIGGGVSKKHKKFMSEDQLKRTRIVPAKLFNQAGIVGAAIWAAEAR